MASFINAMKKAEPVYNVVYSVFLTICKVLLIADIVITSWIVLARYITVIPKIHYRDSCAELGRRTDPDTDGIHGRSLGRTRDQTQCAHPHDSV